MLDAIISYSGWVLGVVGLVLAYLSHAHTQAFIRDKPRSLAAQLERIFFGSFRRMSDVPTSVLIGEILHNEAYKREMELVVRRAGFDESDSIRNRLEGREGCRVHLSDATRYKVAKLAFSYRSFLASVLCEFGHHSAFLQIDAEYEDVSLPLRDGYFVKIAKRGDVIHLEDVEKLEIEIDSNQYWRLACDAYYVALNLPFRTLHDPGAFELHNDDDIRVIYQTIRKMYENFLVYVAISKGSSKISKDSVSLLGQLISRAEMSVARLDELFVVGRASWNRQHFANYFAEAETLISLVHKGVIGELVIPEKMAVDWDGMSALSRVWSGSSIALRANARKPLVLEQRERNRSAQTN